MESTKASSDGSNNFTPIGADCDINYMVDKYLLDAGIEMNDWNTFGDDFPKQANNNFNNNSTSLLQIGTCSIQNEHISSSTNYSSNQAYQANSNYSNYQSPNTRSSVQNNNLQNDPHSVLLHQQDFHSDPIFGVQQTSQNVNYANHHEVMQQPNQPTIHTYQNQNYNSTYYPNSSQIGGPNNDYSSYHPVRVSPGSFHNNTGVLNTHYVVSSSVSVPHINSSSSWSPPGGSTSTPPSSETSFSEDGAHLGSPALPIGKRSNSSVSPPVGNAGGRKGRIVMDNGKTVADQPVTKRGKKAGKKRKKRDPNEPSKPVSAYALFFRDTQAAIKGQKPDATFGEVSKLVAHMWDSLHPEKKADYKRRTEDAKKEYLQKLAVYRATKIGCETNENDNFVPEIRESVARGHRNLTTTNTAPPGRILNTNEDNISQQVLPSHQQCSLQMRSHSTNAQLLNLDSAQKNQSFSQYHQDSLPTSVENSRIPIEHVYGTGNV